jgi:hypothetical protein
MPHRLDSLSLSSLEDENQLDIPKLDLQLPNLDLQSLLHCTKTESFRMTIAAPDYNLDKFIAIGQSKTNMPMKILQIFHGDGHVLENPVDLLKSFNHAIRQQSTMVSADKLDAFGDYLGTGLQAEIWFKAL